MRFALFGLAAPRHRPLLPFRALASSWDGSCRCASDNTATPCAAVECIHIHAHRERERETCCCTGGGCGGGPVQQSDKHRERDAAVCLGVVTAPAIDLAPKGSTRDGWRDEAAAVVCVCVCQCLSVRLYACVCALQHTSKRIRSQQTVVMKACPIAR